MIRAIRPAAMAQDDATMIAGWNISPNAAYILYLTPGASACGVFLFDTGMTMIASGAALVGTAQPCVLVQNAGTVGMVDADLGWHLLITTDGTESERVIRIGPAVDLPDEIHPIYGDDDLAVVRATAGINAAAHYTDDLAVSCPNGLGAGLGSIVSVPADGADIVGQSESITWTGTPNGASESAVVRRHVAIAPEPHVDPVPITPPAVADDEADTDAVTEASGNVLANDEPGLTVVAVNGLAANVGIEVAGSDGGVFVIDDDGAWTFDPDGDFAALEVSETADTSVTYHASDGTSEAMATLTVTVSSSAAEQWTPAEITTALWLDAADAGTITLTSGKVSQWRDKSGNSRHVAQATAAAQPVITAAAQNGLDVVTFDAGDVLSTSANFPETGNAEFSVFWVSAKTTTAKGCVFGWGNVGTALGATGWYDDGTYIGIGYGGGHQYYSSAPPAGYNVLGYVKSAGAINTTSDMRINGTGSGTTGHSTSTPNIAAQPFSVGRWAGYTSALLAGSIAELIVLPVAAVAATREFIEGYLAHKWGLAALLPSGHPYKSTPPTV